MARRAAGEGNIRKRADGRWEGRYVAGHDAEGKPIRTVSGMLGHADPGFTLRTYTYTSNPMQAKAAETIGSVMGKNL